MKRALHALACIASFVLCFSLVSCVQDAAYLPPCPTEDSVQCYWDASTSGNGLGQGVVNP